MKFSFDFNQEKDSVLKETRGIGFEDIIEILESGKPLDDLDNPNFKRYPGQKIFIVRVKKYTYVVPYVVDEKRKVFFLKTFYPSRKYNKKYIGKG